MKLRSRKLIGTIATVVFLVIYALFAAMFGGILVVGRGVPLELPFYLIAGLGWLPASMWIIRWMSKPDPLS